MEPTERMSVTRLLWIVAAVGWVLMSAGVAIEQGAAGGFMTAGIGLMVWALATLLVRAV